MNIIVLCGGLSSERDVSISSGIGVTRALRERGHKAVLVDLFLGYPGSFDDPMEVFDRPWDDQGFSIREDTPDLDAVRAEADALETIVGAKYWPLPTYQELLTSI